MPAAKQNSSWIFTSFVLHDLQLSEDHDLRVRRELKLLGRDLLHEVPAHGSVRRRRRALRPPRSFGERFSARLFAAALEKVRRPCSARHLLGFRPDLRHFRDAQPHLEQTKQRGRDVLLPLLEAGRRLVLQASSAQTPTAASPTLGATARIFPRAIIAHVVDGRRTRHLTDVDGIYTANPKESAEARLLA